MAHARLTASLAAAALVVLAACSDDARTPLAPAAAPAAARAAGQIPTRAQERPGTFVERSDRALWQDVAAGGGVATVGLKAPGAPRGFYHGKVLVDRPTWSQADHAVLAQKGVTLLQRDDLLPTLKVRLESLEALSAVRKLGFVDYVEPVVAAGDLNTHAGVGGCSWGDAWTGDRQYTASGDIYSQKFTAMGIPSAWTLSSGAGVTIGLIDTGISSGQGQFLSTFTAGESGGRTLRLMYVSPTFTSAYDACGHGTRMAGIIAAPRDGASVGGIAYRSSLVAVRHADGVAAVSSSDAKYGVRGALQNGSKVIAMAWESLNWWWQVSDEIEYWHYNYPVLFFGAAGTSGCNDGILDSNVVFPADMPEVVAVTGVNYPGGGVPCGIHHGSDVELTAYLDVPSTGQYTGDVVSMGGSSNATAVVSSVAALVWSRNPAMTRDQVRQRLWQTAQYYPSRSSEEGYGVINAYRAVSGN
ncbi:S8/S53 family peptidase [Longimicrobium sp.]|uniref:S8/S53 family peptidase n=1 Tax=Longimicrobium sp. TaxID=2029185 RepID=UPI002C9E9885|nr:S8/S53 family peptidase [Longimicrobium sp.]HSU16971.1 S8/S53 family peptidase [Longimicrobium sp.]